MNELKSNKDILRTCVYYIIVHICYAIFIACESILSWEKIYVRDDKTGAV